MEKILRSTFRFDPTDDRSLLLSNCLELQSSRLRFLIPEHQAVWDFVEAFVRDHSHAPDFETIQSHFTNTDKNPDVVNILEPLKLLNPIYRGDFQKRLAQRVEERRTSEVEMMFRKATEINKEGWQDKDNGGRVYKGPQDAISYVLSKAQDIGSPVTGIRREGEVGASGEQFIEDYDRRKNDPNYGKGQLCGLMQMDLALGGAKKDQLWTHAGFTGHGKSMFAMNWAYNQSVYFQFSSCYFSLEMPYDQCLRIMYTMHSLHEKFNKVRIKLGIQKDPQTPVGLSYRFIRDGKLPDNEETFLKKFVVPDFCDPAMHYGKIHFKGYDPDMEEFRVTDLRSKSEMLFRESPFKMLIVDHILLMDAKKSYRSTTERANEVVRDLKKLAEIFNRGEGMAVLGLFQISREGLKRADKNNGLYKLYDLSYSNEIERSSDIVTASYLDDELRNRCRMLFQCIKSRDDEAPDPFYSRIDWASRKLLTCLEVPQFVKDQKNSFEDELEADSEEADFSDLLD